MKSSAFREEKLTYWQLIFRQSKVNGGYYRGEELARHRWDWPKGTYLQRRLHKLKLPERGTRHED